MMRNSLKHFLGLIFLTQLFLIPSIAMAKGETELPLYTSLSAVEQDDILISPDGNYLIASAYPYVELWNIKSGISKEIPELINKTILDVAFSSNSEYFAVSYGVQEQEIQLFDTRSGERIETYILPYDDYSAYELSFTKDNKRIIAEVRDGIRTLDLESKKGQLLQVAGYIEGFAPHPTKNEYAVFIDGTPGNDAKNIQLRDENTGAIIKTISDGFPVASGVAQFLDLAYSPNGEYLVASYQSKNIDHTAIYRVKDGYTLLKEIDGHGKISFSKDSGLMVLGDRVYLASDEFKTSYAIRQRGANEIIQTSLGMLTPDGNYYIYSDDKGLHLLDATNIDVYLKEIGIVPSEIKLESNTIVGMGLMGTYSNGSKAEINPDRIQWKARDFGIVEVSKGQVLGLNNGKTTLTAAYGELTSEAVVFVADAPNGLTASHNGEQINLSWNTVQNSADFRGYNLYRKATNGEYPLTPLTDFPIQDGSYVDTAIIGNLKYTYKVTAVYRDGESIPSPEASASQRDKQVVLQVGNPTMIVNGIEKEVDAGRGTTPIVYDGRALLPIKALIEELGGSVEWNDYEQKLTLTLYDSVIEIWINSPNAKVNGTQKLLDVAPRIENGRTFVPLRFAAENLGTQLEWDGSTQRVIITYGSGFNGAAALDGSNNWYDEPYTFPVSDDFGRYVDSGFGYSMNYPLSWGKPKVVGNNNFDFKTLTTFYQSDVVSIQAYANFIDSSVEEYLLDFELAAKQEGHEIVSVEQYWVPNATDAYLIELTSGAVNTVSILVFKEGQVLHLETYILFESIAQEQATLQLFTEIIGTLEVDEAVG